MIGGLRDITGGVLGGHSVKGTVRMPDLRAAHSLRRITRLRKRVQTRLRSYLAALVSVPVFLGKERSCDSEMVVDGCLCFGGSG